MIPATLTVGKSQYNLDVVAGFTSPYDIDCFVTGRHGLGTSYMFEVPSIGIRYQSVSKYTREESK